MAEFTFLLIGNLFLIGISIKCVLSKKIFPKAWPGGPIHVILLFLSLVVLGIFCGIFALLNALESNIPLAQSLMKGVVAGLYVTSFALLGFSFFCGFLPIWRKGRDFPQMSSKMFH